MLTPEASRFIQTSSRPTFSLTARAKSSCVTLASRASSRSRSQRQTSAARRIWRSVLPPSLLGSVCSPNVSADSSRSHSPSRSPSPSASQASTPTSSAPTQSRPTSGRSACRSSRLRSASTPTRPRRFRARSPSSRRSFTASRRRCQSRSAPRPATLLPAGTSLLHARADSKSMC